MKVHHKEITSMPTRVNSTDRGRTNSCGGGSETSWIETTVGSRDGEGAERSVARVKSAVRGRGRTASVRTW